MTEITGLIGYAVLGLAFGSVYYWSLWVTVKWLPGVSRPAMWMLLSMLSRFSMVLSGLFLIARFGGWRGLLVAVVGLVAARTIARIIVVRRWPGRETSRSKAPTHDGLQP